MTLSDENLRMAHAMIAICDRPGNPLGWLILEEHGLTADVIREASESPGWMGPKPDWDSYPCEGFRKAYEAKRKTSADPTRSVAT